MAVVRRSDSVSAPDQAAAAAKAGAKLLLILNDGYGKYDASDPVAMKAHFVAEKKREDRLRRHEGGFTRWDLADALRVTPLRDKLILAGVPIVRASQPAMLATLRRAPRLV